MFRNKQSLPVLVLIGIHIALIAWSGSLQSPTVDEVAHLPAGISHWKFNKYELYCVNPPLVRMTAAVPVLFAAPKLDWKYYITGPGLRSEFKVGDHFIRLNQSRSLFLFQLARWACIPFSVLGAWICYRWSTELYGYYSGLMALSLWCFSPNILAHAQLISTDTAAASLGITACYLFWKWLRTPTWTYTVMTGFVLGIVELTKTSWIILFLIWPLLWLLIRFVFAKQFAVANKLEQHTIYKTVEYLKLIFILGLAVYILNSSYGFQGTLTKLGEYNFVSPTLAGDYYSEGKTYGNRFKDMLLAGIPVPLPKDYVMGIDIQKKDFDMGARSYLAGEWKQTGWWYYYLYALMIKVPIGTLVLFLVSLARSFLRPYQKQLANELVLLIPALALFVLVSSQISFNHHMRYILPVFPFVFVWISKTADIFASSQHFLQKGICTLAMVWMIISSLWIYPHSLSYFNELVHGPGSGHNYLLYSNIDWGQDLIFLQKWLKENQRDEQINLAYFGSFNPNDLGIQFDLPPTLPELPGISADQRRIGPYPGLYAISVNYLHGHHFRIYNGKGYLYTCNSPYFTYFNEFKPIASAGYSIYIYRISLEEANRVRLKLGLASLSEKEGNKGGR